MFKFLLKKKFLHKFSSNLCKATQKVISLKFYNIILLPSHTLFWIPQELAQGVEFVGRTDEGQRFMGIVSGKAIANVVECDKNLLLPIPNEWTFEEAATVYFTYAKVEGGPSPLCTSH